MTARALYNEIDGYCCAWLSNLMGAGEITPGTIDDRPIQELTPDDVRGFERVHFFAGVGGWDVALDLAGWGDRPVWTGSCPCQPFSAAGAGKAADDERHLWPAWSSLIAECRPGTIFGEQVEAAVGWGWLDAVFTDLEAEGYACGAAVLPACGVGAPHIRNRLWFVADANEGRGGRDAGAVPSEEGETRGRVRRLADCAEHARGQQRDDAEGRGEPRELGNATGAGRQGLADGGRTLHPQRAASERAGRVAGAAGRFWSDAIWLPCTDGKARPAKSGTFVLAHGIQRRPSKLRAYGNAIVPQVAAEVVAAFMGGAQ